MNFVYKVVCVLLTGLLLQTTLADVVYLDNGDRLTGTIEQLADGQMTFKSVLAGKVTLENKHIKSFETTKEIDLCLADGQTLKQRIKKAPPGQVATIGSNSEADEIINIAAITAINPPAPTVARWSGSVSAGFNLTKGNTETSSQNLSIKVKKRNDKDRIQVSGDYKKTQQKQESTGTEKTTVNWWKTRAKYDYFFTKRLFAYADGRYEIDRIADLDRRVITGLGGGFQWIESEKTNFSIEGGLASLYEKYDNTQASTTELSGQIGYDFDTAINHKISFVNNLTFYPSFDDFADYLLTTSAEFKLKINDHLFTNIKAIYDYDATPATDKGKTDTKYMFGIGWNF